MHFVLDLPNSDSVLDVGRFAVRGWFWAGDKQSSAAAVEVWSGDRFLGDAAGFAARSDVVAALDLPASVHPGFDFFVNYPTVEPGQEFELCLRIRWADGSKTGDLAKVRVRSMDVGMPVARATARSAVATHEARVAPLPVRASSALRDFGIEIGAFKTPIPGITPYYFDRFPEYDYEPVNADYVADAERLPIHSDSLDYVANANVFEHLANPVAALWEWARVVRHGGLIYLVVPDRRHTFDRLRPLTAPEHMMEDFERGTTDSDGTHVTDYIDGVDWSVWGTYATLEERLVKREQLRVAYTAAVAAGQPINIHFHTFELSSFIKLVGLMNRHPRRTARLELVDASEFFPASHPSGFLALLRVRKNLAARLRGYARSFGARGNFDSVLTAAAKPFPGAIKPTRTE